ncbi:MAG: glycerol-3-phosphate 1-O-acyltransferase PlsY [Rhizomicrobium sp.]
MFDLLGQVDWADAWPYYLGVIVFGYLLGSIPFGLIFTRLSGAGDVRDIGSGGIGATNVLRTGKYWAAAATLLCDAAKGAIAVLLVRWHFHNEVLATFAGLGAFLGHLFPVWLGFKGGKGVAVSLGILLAVYWPGALVALAVWLLMLAIFRISSLAALVAALCTPIIFFLLHQAIYIPLTIALAVLVIVVHRQNIARLLTGTEPRVGAKKA